MTQEEARAHILGRQGLSTPFATPIDAFRGIFAIQTQYASSLPIALGLRLKKLKPTWHAEWDHQSILKCWTLRSTLHAHTEADHAIAVAALRDRLRTRYMEWFKSELGFDDSSIERLEDEVCAALGDGPKTRVDLHSCVPSLKKIPYAGWGLDLKGLAFAGRIKIMIEESGATKFALHECPEKWAKDDAIAELMRRYFAAFGPATLNDFRYWTGLFAADVKRAFEVVENQLGRVQVEGWPGDRFMLGDKTESRVPKVMLLAKFDPLTLGHLDKTLFLSDADRTQVFRKAGQVEAGVLVDGKFVGTWRINRRGKGAEVVVEPFRRISTARVPALKREAKRAARALRVELVDLRFRS